MLFNSLEYVVYFPAVVCLYFIATTFVRRNAVTRILLLSTSLYFYMRWKPAYIVLILFSILVTWTSGLLMERGTLNKKLILIMSLVLNFSILYVFKYYNFIATIVSSIAAALSLPARASTVDLLLPVGISFYTFQALGYSIDVYRGDVKAEHNLVTYALFVTFFPQLVAGPIERTNNLLPQFKVDNEFDYGKATNGLKKMAWGMFKKVVIADRLSTVVSTVYGNPERYEGLALIIATVCFAFQIFCDFSGYSDIAVGSARVMGFSIMENFRSPYLSRSISEFWKRWHISLSTWFKDYVYIPLGGNRASKGRWLFNIMATFTISGLWHGANWTYVVWGALNGLYLVLSIQTQNAREAACKATGLDEHPHVHEALQILFTFTLVCLSWIFFRARDLGQALYIVAHLFSGFRNIADIRYLKDTILSLGLDKEDLCVAGLAIAGLEIVHNIQRRHSVIALLSTKPAVVRWLAYYGLISAIILFGVFGKNGFIYFQF